MSNCCMRRPGKFHVDSAVRFWAIANIREGGRQTPPPPVKPGLSFFANNVRTDGSIGKGKALIDVTNPFDVWVSQFLLLATPNLLHYCSSMSVIHRWSRVCFDGVLEWWEHHAWRTCNWQRYHCRVANFIIEITNVHIYDFGPKAMHSNAGL